MYVQDVANYFRSMTDEPDKTFITDAQLVVMLQVAYNEFRTMVTAQDSSPYEETYNVAATGLTYLDLNGSLLGPTATLPVLQRIVRVCQIISAANPTITRVLRPAASLETMRNGTAISESSYFLQNRVLRFSRILDQAIQIQYLPVPTVDWAGGLNGGNKYIDDLSEWHDIIALIAMSQYQVKDFQQNPAAIMLLNQRKKDFHRYISESRNGDAARYVSSGDFLNDTGW